MFHLNPNIGKNGPFFFNVGKDRVLTGFLGNAGDTEAQCIDKLDRILRNYKYIQSHLEGLEWDKSEFITGEISKHPINKLTQDRVMILGEAAGLVTAFFYEGLFSGLVSANLAANTVKSLLSKGSEFTNSELKKYQQEVHRILLEKYYKNGEGFEHIFFNSSSSQIDKMWKTYIEFVNESKRLRRNIWEAHRAPPEKYDIEKDKWAGRQLFNKLSFSDKISLGSKFLSALMKIY
jgi:flavin-dependent dehydrogenase